MTSDSSDRRQRMAALLEEAFDSGALVFSDPLFGALEADAPKAFFGRVRTEHGIEYDIDRKLGRGGMATVYLARDAKHDRAVAIKVLHADLTTRTAAERFVREIRLMARLQHPHVLALLDSGVFEGEGSVREPESLAGRSFYTMPYLEGESLRVRLARDGALPLADAIRVLREVADALSYAHERGVIHRDIKPANILLSGGHAVVADFGIAKALAAAQHDERAADAKRQDSSEFASANEPSSSPSIDLTQSSTLLGTPGYMAPEQAAAEGHIDHRADLYAWGVVACETLSGRRPFGSTRNAGEPLSTRVSEVRSIRDVVPGVPVALGRLVMRCLATAPVDRPSSAAEVVAELDSIAIDTRVARASPPVAARRVRRGVMAGIVLLIVLAAASVYVMESHPMVGGRATVVGTGSPAIDVAAVQAAVNRADTVVLEGSFSFNTSPTKPLDPMLASAATVPSPRSAQVLVSKAVTISGVADARGRLTTIDGGTIPFYVDAPRARVSIRGLRFVRPVFAAVEVHAVRGLEVAGNRIEGLKPFGGGAAAIDINTSGAIPVPSDSGRPDLVSGTLFIRQNEIDVTGGTPREAMLGVRVWSVGASPHSEVALEITGNHVRNTTSSAIMVRRANGRVRIVENTMETSTEGKEGEQVEAVRLANAGRFRMADNHVECRWSNCVGIAVFGQYEEWPVLGAIVEHNEVNMLPPPGTVFADYSAAIKVKGFADSNVVRYNTIRGRARAALALETFKSGYPRDNAFIDNHVDGFQASVKSVVVGPGVLRTRLVHPGTVDDHGEGTKIER